MAELQIKEFKQPETIQFNYEELKAELAEKVQTYELMVYTEDTMKEAKADRASLNRLKKALNDERIKREKEYLLITFSDACRLLLLTLHSTLTGTHFLKVIFTV